MKVFGADAPVSVLAPMQDVTDAGFMDIVASCGAPDFFVAEYFRVHEYSVLDAPVLNTVRSRPGGRKVCAQFIGEDEFHIARMAAMLREYPEVEGLDLNAGCPSPKVYRKNVGGALMKDPGKIRSILKVMRAEWPGALSVKIRTGFEDSSRLAEVVDIANECGADFMTVHGRTVKQLYRGSADYSAIASAAARSEIPVIANGDITSARKAFEVLSETSCAGVMIGRHAVRNPWIFRQISDISSGREMFRPTLADVYSYVERLHDTALSSNPNIRFLDGRMKKFLNFIALGVDRDGGFLRAMRAARGVGPLFETCKTHLLSDPGRPFFDEPSPDLCPRPNHEL